MGADELEVESEPGRLDGEGQVRFEEVLGPLESVRPTAVVPEIGRLIVRRRALGEGDDVLAVGDPAGEVGPGV